MSRTAHTGYSLAQIILHWTVVVLVIFQFVAHDAMSEAWDAYRDGAAIPAGDVFGANLHATVGIVIFVLALARLFLRLTRGVPPLPADQPAAIRFLAIAAQYTLYVLIIGLPVLGGAAWFGGIKPAAGIHSLGADILFWVALLHATGALYEHFIAKNDVLRRMLKPEAS